MTDSKGQDHKISKNDSALSSEKLSSYKKVVFFILTLAIPVFFFVILEIGLRLANYGGNLELFVPDSASQAGNFILNKNFTKRYFFKKGIKTPIPISQRFSAQKDSTSYRVFCLGASTTQGFPYQPNAAFPAQLQNILATFHPKRNIEVINCGITALTSLSVLDMAEEILENYSPDLIVVYSGHNEFYGALGQASNLAISKNYTFIRSFLKLQHSRLFLLLRDTYIYLFGEDIRDLSLAKNTTLMERFARDIDIPFESEMLSRTEAYYKLNLQEIIDLAKQHETDIMLCNLVSNIADFQPFSSDFENGAAQDSSLLEKAKILLEEASFYKAKQAYNELIRKYPKNAGIHYQLAQSYRSLNLIDSAAMHYELARDYDKIRFRAPGSFNIIIKDLAAENEIILVDINRAFQKASQFGIIGNELVLEHVHPNFKGYYVMASNIAKTMYDNRLISKKWDLSRNRGDKGFMAMCGLTDLDHEVANYSIFSLTSQWPFPTANQERRYQRVGTEKTEDIARQIIDKKQTNLVQAHLDLGEEYLQNNQVKKGLAEYKAALAIKPHCDIYNRIGPVCTKQAELAFRAKEDYEKALTYFRQGIYYFNKGLEHCPDHFQLNFNAGLLYALRADKLQNALTHFQKALELNPKHKKTMLMIARIHISQKEFESAKRILKQGLELYPMNVEFYSDLGLLYTIKKEYVKAENWLNKALELEPYNNKTQKVLKQLQSNRKQSNG